MISRVFLLAGVVTGATLSIGGEARAQDRAEDHPRPGRPFPRPTLQWIAGQIVPSPGFVVTEQGTYAHLEWQLTPLLYAFGLRREVFRVRTVVIEPSARLGGSIEVFLSPEYTARPGPATQEWAVRFGARLYVPVLQHGDNLAVSLGLSDRVEFDGANAVGYEVGTYAMFGLFGIQAVYSPRTRDGQALWLNLRVRYF